MLLKAFLLLHLAFSFCSAYNLNGVLSDSELPINGDNDEDHSASSTTQAIRGRKGRFLRRNPLPVYQTETPLSDEIMENFEMLRRNDKTKRKYVVEVPVPVPSEEEEESKASLSEIHYAPSSETPESTYVPDIQFFQYEDIQQLVNKNAQKNAEEKPETNKESKKILQYRPRYNQQTDQPWESGKVSDHTNNKKATDNYYSTTMSSAIDINEYKEEKEVQLEEIKKKPKYYNYQDGYDTNYYYTHQKKPKYYAGEEIENKYADSGKIPSKNPEIDSTVERKPQSQRYQNVQKHTNVIHDSAKLKDEQYLEGYPSEGRKIKENYTQKQYKFINDLIKTPDGKQQNNFRIVIDNSTNNDEEVRSYRYKPMSEEKIVEYVKTHYPKDKIAQSVIVISNDEENKFVTHYKPVRKYKKHTQEKHTTPYQDSEVSESSIQEAKQEHLRQHNKIKESEGITVEPYSTRGQVQDVGKKTKETKEELHHAKEHATEKPEVVRIGQHHHHHQNKPQQFQFQEYPYEILKENAPVKQKGQSYQLKEYAYDVRDQNYEIRIKSKPSKELKTEEQNSNLEDKPVIKHTDEHTTKSQQKEMPKMQTYINLHHQNQEMMKQEPKDVSYEVTEISVDKKQKQTTEREKQNDLNLNQLKVGLGGYWKDLGPVQLKAVHQPIIKQEETKQDDNKQGLVEQHQDSVLKTRDESKTHYLNQLNEQLLVNQPEIKLSVPNKAPEQLIIYKIQQSKQNLPYPELNVLYAPKNHKQIKSTHLNTVNDDDGAKPKLKLVDPQLVYLAQQQKTPQHNLQQHNLPQFGLQQHDFNQQQNDLQQFKLAQHDLTELKIQQHKLPQHNLQQIDLQKYNLPQLDLQKQNDLPQHYAQQQFNFQQQHDLQQQNLPHHDLLQQHNLLPQHDLLQQNLLQHDLPQQNLQQHDLQQNSFDSKTPELNVNGFVFNPKKIIRYTDADNIFKNDQKEQTKQQDQTEEDNKSELKYPDSDFMYKFKPNQEEEKAIEQDETKEKLPEFSLYKQPNQSKKTISDYVVHSTSETQPSDFIASTTIHPTLLNIKFSSSHYEPSEKVKRGPYKLIFPQKT